MSHFTLPTKRYLKASPGTAIIEQVMLVDIPFIADWKKIGEHRQPTDGNTDRENEVELIMTQGGHKVLVRNNGIPPQSKVKVSERALANNVH